MKLQMFLLHLNKDLFLKMLRNYNEWQLKNASFHPTFDADYAKLRRNYYMQYATTGTGILFAGTVWNPNFVNRRSWYMRKISIGWWALVGYNFGRKYYED